MTTSPRPNWTLALGLPLLVMIACTIIVFSPLFAANATRFSTAITLDLTLTAPLLYFLAIRKTTVSKMTVIRVFALGVLVAGLLLSQRSPLLHGIKTWISPVVEAIVIFTVVLKFRQARRSIKDRGQMDFLTQVRAITSAALGSERAGGAMGSEIAVFYYAFAPSLSFGPGKKTRDDGHNFSYSKSGGAIPIIGAFLICLLAEGIGCHFLIAHWSPRTAWVITGLSIYTMLQLLAHARAIKTRPIRVDDEWLYLRNGLAADARIRMADIVEATLTTRMTKGEEALKLAFFKSLESHTVRIKLRQPVTVIGMFGIRRQAGVLLFAVDRAEELVEMIRAAGANIPGKIVYWSK